MLDLHIEQCKLSNVNRYMYIYRNYSLLSDIIKWFYDI